MAELLLREGIVISKKAELDAMPPEVLESIYKSTDGNSSVALMLTSKAFLDKLDNSKQFWKHVAGCNDLDNDEWKENNFEDTAQSWKNLYLKLKKTRAKLISHQHNLETSRIFVDLKNRIETSSTHRDSVPWQQVQQFGSKNSRNASAETFEHCSEDAIGKHIFGSGFSDKYMVVFVSKLDFDHLTYVDLSSIVETSLFVWNVEKEITFSFSLENHQICLRQLRCEEMLVWEHFLIVMRPSKESLNNVPLIEVYDIRSPSVNIAASFYLNGSVSMVKFLVEKEEGGQKLSVWNKKLLVVSPEKRGGRQNLSLHLLDLAPLMSLAFGDDHIVLEELWSVAIDNVVVECPFSFFAIDQKGPAFVLAINKALGNQCLGQQFVYLNLDVQGEVFYKISESRDIERALADVEIPVFGFYQIDPFPDFELDPNITNVRLECLIATSDQLSKFAILTTNGTIITHHQHKGFSAFRPITHDYVDIDTYSDELHIYREKIIVMKIFKPRGHDKKRLTFLTTFDGEVLWKVDHSSVLNPDQRLFLSPMFNLIFVSSADELVVYDINNGNLLTKLQYPEVKKYPVSVSEDLYSQSGCSIWDIRRVGDRIAVTHDIERANPVMADWINVL